MQTRPRRSVRELLQRGARVDAVNEGGWTPLMYSSGEPAVGFLLQFGADRSLLNNRGKTARDVAVARGRVQVVEVLDTYFPLTVQLEQVLLGACVVPPSRHSRASPSTARTSPRCCRSWRPSTRARTAPRSSSCSARHEDNAPPTILAVPHPYTAPLPHSPKNRRRHARARHDGQLQQQGRNNRQPRQDES